MTAPKTSRAGVILAVADVARSTAWYRDKLGFAVDAEFDDPPYAILSLAGARLSLAEQGHPADDRPGVSMIAPEDPSRPQAMVVLEVADCRADYENLKAAGVEFLAEPYAPPWGGARCFAVDPDRFLVELEELA